MSLGHFNSLSELLSFTSSVLRVFAVLHPPPRVSSSTVWFHRRISHLQLERSRARSSSTFPSFLFFFPLISNIFLTHKLWLSFQYLLLRLFFFLFFHCLSSPFVFYFVLSLSYLLSFVIFFFSYISFLLFIFILSFSSLSLSSFLQT